MSVTEGFGYTGNQPTSVSESASDNNTSGAMEYKKANGSGYKFNANGSLQADKSRVIAYITYDYGARQHDPILARWDRIDPLCEVIAKHRIR